MVSHLLRSLAHPRRTVQIARQILPSIQNAQQRRWINLLLQMTNNSQYKNKAIIDWLPYDHDFEESVKKCIVNLEAIKPPNGSKPKAKSKDINLAKLLETQVTPGEALIPRGSWNEDPRTCIAEALEADLGEGHSARTYHKVGLASKKKLPKKARDRMIILTGQEPSLRLVALLTSAYTALMIGHKVNFYIRLMYVPPIGRLPTTRPRTDGKDAKDSKEVQTEPEDLKEVRRESNELKALKVTALTSRDIMREMILWNFMHLPHLRPDVILRAMPEGSRILMSPHSNGAGVQFVIGKDSVGVAEMLEDKGGEGWDSKFAWLRENHAEHAAAAADKRQARRQARRDRRAEQERDMGKRSVRQLDAGAPGLERPSWLDERRGKSWYGRGATRAQKDMRREYADEASLERAHKILEELGYDGNESLQGGAHYTEPEYRDKADFQHEWKRSRNVTDGRDDGKRTGIPNPARVGRSSVSLKF